MNNKSIYVLCNKCIFNVFIDYYNSFNQYLKNTLILYDSYDDYKNLLNNENNILLFLRIIPENILNNCKCIIYFINTEQTTVLKRIDFIKKYFKSNIKILDYSKENLYILNNKYKYKNTLYLPYIYNPKEIYNIEKKKMYV